MKSRIKQGILLKGRIEASNCTYLELEAETSEDNKFICCNLGNQTLGRQNAKELNLNKEYLTLWEIIDNRPKSYNVKIRIKIG